METPNRVYQYFRSFSSSFFGIHLTNEEREAKTMTYTIFGVAHVAQFLAPDVDLGPRFGLRRKSTAKSRLVLTRANTLIDVMPILY